MSIIIVYVDDFLGVHREDYDIDEVTKAFRWGVLHSFEVDRTVTFKGQAAYLAAEGDRAHLPPRCASVSSLNLTKVLGPDQRGEFPSMAERPKPARALRGELAREPRGPHDPR